MVIVAATLCSSVFCGATYVVGIKIQESATEDPRRLLLFVFFNCSSLLAGLLVYLWHRRQMKRSQENAACHIVDFVMNPYAQTEHKEAGSTGSPIPLNSLRTSVNGTHRALLGPTGPYKAL
jgi:hypothetical protein